jgi:hypothetical protein
VFFTSPDDARWNAKRQAVALEVEIGEARAVRKKPVAHAVRKKPTAHAVHKKSYRHAVRKKSRRWMRFKKAPGAYAVRKVVGQPRAVMDGRPKASARNDGAGSSQGGDSAMVERIKTRWPRLMSEADAAEYVGVSLEQFRIEREKKGLWPKPVDRGCRRNTYDRKDLDDAVDRLKRGIDHPISDVDLDREFGLGRDQDPVPRDAQTR